MARQHSGNAESHLVGLRCGEKITPSFRWAEKLIRILICPMVDRLLDIPKVKHFVNNLVFVIHEYTKFSSMYRFLQMKEQK